MRVRASLLATLVAGVATEAAVAAEGERAGTPLSEDPLLRELLDSSLQSRPELAEARARIAALQERIGQSRVLADPTLALGIQNDGFGGIQVGKMPMSWYYIVASQTLPWPGKRGLRADVTSLDVRSADIELRRQLLGIAAEVERAYVELLLVRGQLGLLGRLASLWQQAEVAARARYEAGGGAQSDQLRAQLERNRLQRRHWTLLAEERRRVTVLDRLAGRPMDAPLATKLTLAELADPEIPEVGAALATAWAESPELARARLAGEQAERRMDLARRERWPDVTVSAGVMPRGSGFETMWQAGISLNLPVWSAIKQGRVMAENQARGRAAHSGAAAVRQLIETRVRERLELLRALVQSNRLYRSSLLVQSEATVASTLAQYQVGRVTFASVLEALSGHLADVNGYLESIAAAQRIAIAVRENSLDSPEGGGAGSMTGGGVPGAGGMSSSGAGAAGPAELPETAGAGPSMQRM